MYMWCVCIFVGHVYARVQMQVCALVCGDLRLVLGIFLDCAQFFLRQGHFLSLELVDSGCSSQCALRTPCLSLPSTRLTGG